MTPNFEMQLQRLTKNLLYTTGHGYLFHRLTRTAYVYNGCLPLNNIV